MRDSGAAFYNTTGESGRRLQLYIAQAVGQ